MVSTFGNVGSSPYKAALDANTNRLTLLFLAASSKCNVP